MVIGLEYGSETELWILDLIIELRLNCGCWTRL